MNRISDFKATTARSMFALGESVRIVSVSVGISEMTAWTLQKKVRAEMGVIYCQCGKVAGHKGWCGFRVARSPNRIKSLLGQFRDIATIQIIVPSRPCYERPEIENERETEIRLLVNQRNAILLDAPISDGEGSKYEMLGNNSLTPLEILLIKEEQESEEWRQRKKSIVEWHRWRRKAKTNETETHKKTQRKIEGCAPPQSWSFFGGSGSSSPALYKRDR